MKCYIYGTICKIAIVKLGNCCALLIIVLFLTLIARLKWLWNIHKIYETEGKFFLFEIQTRVNSITSPLLRDTGVFVNHVLSKQFDFCVSLTNCWIKFMAMEKVNNKVCDAQRKPVLHSQKHYLIWSRLFFKNDCTTITSSCLSGVDNFCALSG